MAFSPDGTQLATASSDQMARLWDARTGDLLLTFQGHAEAVNGVAFSLDGTRLATASRGPDSPAVGHPQRRATRDLQAGHLNVVSGVAFSPDGTRVATSSLDGTVRLWDPETGHPFCSNFCGTPT